MKNFKTPKGTELQIIQLQGKDYLNVQWRLVWMREEHPSWSILSEAVSIDDRKALFKATVIDENGRILSQSHKTSNDPRYFVERAETGAIGRALAMVGYGTQFCGDELEEGDEIADAPVDRSTYKKTVIPMAVESVTEMPPKELRVSAKVVSKVGQDFGEVVMKFGRNKGVKFKDISQTDLTSALEWATGKNVFPDMQDAIRVYLASMHVRMPPPQKEIKDLKNKLSEPPSDMFENPPIDDIPLFDEGGQVNENHFK